MCHEWSTQRAGTVRVSAVLVIHFFEAWRFPAGFYSVPTLFHSWDGSDKASPLLIRHDPLIVQLSVQGTQYLEHGKLMKVLSIGKANPHTL